MIKQHYQKIIIGVLALLLLIQCNRSKDLLLSSELSKEKAKEYLRQARTTQKSLKEINARFSDSIAKLSVLENSNQKLLANNAKSVNAKLSDLKHYNSSDKTNYFKDRYNDVNNVIQAENGTTLKDTLTTKVITDLIVGDGAKAEVKILRDVVKTKEAKFDLCATTVDSLNIGIEAMAKNYELANKEKDKSINDTEKALKKERKKKNLWKIISGGLIISTGYLIIAK